MARCWYVDPEERLGFSDLCSVMEQFLSLIPECTELKMVLVEGVHGKCLILLVCKIHCFVVNEWYRMMCTD